MIVFYGHLQRVTVIKEWLINGERTMPLMVDKGNNARLRIQNHWRLNIQQAAPSNTKRKLQPSNSHNKSSLILVVAVLRRSVPSANQEMHWATDWQGTAFDKNCAQQLTVSRAPCVTKCHIQQFQFTFRHRCLGPSYNARLPTSIKKSTRCGDHQPQAVPWVPLENITYHSYAIAHPLKLCEINDSEHRDDVGSTKSCICCKKIKKTFRSSW